MDISGTPYVEVSFDQHGNRLTAVTVPAETTDLFVVSHGWNNTRDEAFALYAQLFFQVARLRSNFPSMAGRKLAIIGLIWPSKRFNESLIIDNGSTGRRIANLNGTAPVDQALEAKVLAQLEGLKSLFIGQETIIDDAKELVPKLEQQKSARDEFALKLRQLICKPEPGDPDEEATAKLFSIPTGSEIMECMRVTEEDLDDAIASSGGAAVLPIGISPADGTGGAASLFDRASGWLGGASNYLNYLTYYEMKTRAGTVGAKGVAPLLDAIDPLVERIHLVGHSFGGRLVTAAANSSRTSKIKSMTLLQAAFSHNGFSATEGGFFNQVVAKSRVAGPLLITHTANDRAVGIAYPLASRLKRDRTMALGDANDKYGGIGRNGAQKMTPGQIDGTEAELRATSHRYNFTSKKLFNLKADSFIPDHGTVTRAEVAHAILSAVAE